MVWLFYSQPLIGWNWFNIKKKILKIIHLHVTYEVNIKFDFVFIWLKIDQGFPYWIWCKLPMVIKSKVLLFFEKNEHENVRRDYKVCSRLSKYFLFHKALPSTNRGYFQHLPDPLRVLKRHPSYYISLSHFDWNCSTVS